jgi:soluble lytic murein transglycosylase
MPKTHKHKRLRSTKIKKPSLRDYGFAALGALLILVGIMLSNNFHNQPVPLSMQSPSVTIPWLPQNVRQWQPLIQEMSSRYDIDPNLVAIIITIESGGNPKAHSGVGAQGLMQIMPATATDIAQKHLATPVTSYDIYDPRTNIEFGTAYLAYLRDQFGTSSQGPSWDQTAELIAASYNGGPGAAHSLQQGNGLRSDETSAYSHDVYNMWRERHAQASPTYDRWSGRGGSRLVGSQ